MKSSVSVRELADFVHRHGDINYRYQESTDPIEGLKTQQRYQANIQRHNRTYKTEQKLRTSHTSHGVSLSISGRVDGFDTATPCCVEEIKTSRTDPHELHQRVGSVYWAQAKLYAAMVVELKELDCCDVKLTYIHPDSYEVVSFRDSSTRADLEGFFKETCESYTEFLSTVLERVQRRNQTAEEQEFPFDSVHDDQLALARRVYASTRDKENLMVEAPTGTGKTIATLYPSVKAMGQDLIDRTVYITAQTTGQRTALDTMRLLNNSNDDLTSISIIAKDRICFSPGATCTPEQCKYAKGHFDRVSAARSDLLKKSTIRRRDIEIVARSHSVCPYELSLDAAEWSDTVICDYNYVFDPFVNLNRLKTKHFSRLLLLIDEAHRLGPRVSDMLSAQLAQEDIRSVIATYRDLPIVQPVKKLNELLANFQEQYLSHDDEARIHDVPEELWKAVNWFLDCIAEMDLVSTDDPLYHCWNAVTRIHGVKERSNDITSACFVRRSDDQVTLEFRCIAPGPWIKSVLTEYRASVRFSGTLSPKAVVDESHGVIGRFVRAQTEPDATRFGVAIVPDVSTYWRDRSATVEKLVEVMEHARVSSEANWLMAFPSFEYLNMAFAHADARHDLRKQQANMSLTDRTKFIEWISEPAARVAMVVMGGVFTESVDYQSDALAGVIVVGPGIPPSSLERELVREQSDLGYEIAYRQPAMTRVVQAAGRVVRHAHDRGVILLVDSRFTTREIQQYFPQHWLPETIRARDVATWLNGFWN